MCCLFLIKCPMSVPNLVCSRHCDRVMKFSRVARASAAQDKDLGMLRANVPGASFLKLPTRY